MGDFHRRAMLPLGSGGNEAPSEWFVCKKKKKIAQVRSAFWLVRDVFLRSLGSTHHRPNNSVTQNAQQCSTKPVFAKVLRLTIGLINNPRMNWTTPKNCFYDNNDWHFFVLKPRLKYCSLGVGEESSNCALRIKRFSEPFCRLMSSLFVCGIYGIQYRMCSNPLSEPADRFPVRSESFIYWRSAPHAVYPLIFALNVVELPLNKFLFTLGFWFAGFPSGFFFLSWSEKNFLKKKKAYWLLPSSDTGDSFLKCLINC